MNSILEETKRLLVKVESPVSPSGSRSTRSASITERYNKKPVYIQRRPETPPEGKKVVIYHSDGEIDVATYKEGIYKNAKGQVVIPKAWFIAPTATGPSFEEGDVPSLSHSKSSKKSKESESKGKEFEEGLDEESQEEFMNDALELCPELSEGRGDPKLDISQTKLHKDERPVDYGHCGEIMKDKYGEEKGNSHYEKLIDHPKAGAVHFVVAQNIQKEKKKMMQDLGIYNGPESLEKEKYETVRAKWLAHKKGDGQT